MHRTRTVLVISAALLAAGAGVDPPAALEDLVEAERAFAAASRLR